MDARELHKEIARRKSIRKYRPEILSDDVLDEVRNRIARLIPLDPDIGVKIEIAGHNELKGLIQVKAPYFAAAYSEKADGYLENMGFLLQQLNLHLASMGLGCCWQGWPKPVDGKKADSGLSYVISLAFGEPDEKPYRDSIGEFRRRSLDSMMSGEKHRDLVEAARIVPFSGKEKWFFVAEDGTVHVYFGKGGPISVPAVERLDRINRGIVLSHLWIAASAKYRNARIAKSDAPPVKGHEYFSSVVWS